MSKFTDTKKADTPKKASGDNLLKKVVSVNLKNVDKATLKEITDNIIDNADLQDTALKTSAKKLVANSIKLSISAQHPELYKYYKGMDYDQLLNLVDMKQATGAPATQMLTMKIPETALATLGEGSVGHYGTSFSISPNSFWANVTNILNEVSVGDNFINTGESFNAWEFYRDATLASGEAALKTIGQTLSGICLLHQNYLVPPNTQMLKGYQASLGVFINVDSAQEVGGGTGIGLFTMYATPINVIKLAVTNPQQFAEMVRIFEATAVNSREYSLWMITTYNLLSNITNIIVDNYNTNIRNCLNGTLFPAIQIMKNPTNEFNLGLIQTQQWSAQSGSTSLLPQILNYEAVISGSLNSVPIDATTYNGEAVKTVRVYSGQQYTNPNSGVTYQAPAFTSPYTVPGSATYPRIQTSLYNDIHLIISPEFFVALKSGTLSELFHWEYQKLEEYVPPENIHMLYKQINIPSGYLDDGNVASGDGNETGYAWNVRASLGDRWFPKNVIYLVTKPADSNQWSAAYGWVWTTDMRNEWGAGMISTTFLHYALYGGVIPWSNGCCFYFKNLMNVVADQAQQITTDFTLGTIINQNQTVSTVVNESGND